MVFDLGVVGLQVQVAALEANQKVSGLVVEVVDQVLDVHHVDDRRRNRPAFLELGRSLGKATGGAS